MDFLYLSQEDCVKAGGSQMRGAMRATERSFYLHSKGDYIQPGKPVVRWGGAETEETTGRVMSMPCYLGGVKNIVMNLQIVTCSGRWIPLE